MRVARNIARLGFLTLGALSLAAAFSAEAQSGGVPSTSTVENVQVTDASSGFPFQAQPSIVVDSQGRIFAGWKETNGVGGFNRVAFGRSLDRGQTWERSFIESGGQFQDAPRLALDESGRVFYKRIHRPGGLIVSRSDDGGHEWGTPVNIHDQADEPFGGSITSDGNGTTYASYLTFAPSSVVGKVISTRSADGGLTWRPGQVVATGLSPAGPTIAATRDGTVHVVWWVGVSQFRPGGNILTSTSRDFGATWGAPVQVNSVRDSAVYDGNIRPVRLPFPSTTTSSGGSVFVAWADRAKGEYNIVVARSDDGGATWSAPVQINDTDSGDQWMAALAVDANDVLHAAWYDDRTGNINVYYASSTDGGRTWSPNVRVTSEATPSTVESLGYLGLAADRRGAGHLIWTDRRDGGSAIYFARLPGCSAPPAPAAGNNGPVRVGETLQLTASPVAGATYGWSGPNAFHSNLQNPSIANVTAAATGTYSVTVTVDGCVSDPATTTATILPAPCIPDPTALCLNSSRFALQVDWRVPSQGTSGRGMATPLTSDTGYFWFFSSNNVELVVKVVDGRAFNGFFWVFYGALSDVEYTLTVSDTLTGAVKTYTNLQGQLASVADTAAFPGSEAAATNTASARQMSPNPSRSAAGLAGSRSRQVARFLSTATLVCTSDATTLCLSSGLFQVRVAWRVPSEGTSGVGQAFPLTSDTGYFWFFSPNNVELVIKVVDGRAFNGHFWVFYGALSDVEYTITVTDTATGAAKTYTNPQGRLASVADTSAF